MKIDPYYQRQKCRPMNLVSENIRFMRIVAGVPLGVGVKPHCGLSTPAIFGEVATSSKTSEIRQAIICDDMLPLVEQLFHDKMHFLPALLESESLNVGNSTTSAIMRCSVHCTIS